MKHIEVRFKKGQTIGNDIVLRNNPTYDTEFGKIDPEILKYMIDRIGDANTVYFCTDVGYKDRIEELCNNRRNWNEQMIRSHIRKNINTSG